MDFRKAQTAFAAIMLIACTFQLEMLTAQSAQVHPGQEVRAYNDSAGSVISGRVFSVSTTVLELIRYPDAPPTRVYWTDIHRLEVKADGVWTPLALVHDPDLFGDSTAAGGALAGAAAGRNSTEASFFLPAFLASAPLGFYLPWAFCGDCSIHPKVIAASSTVAIVVINGRARAKAKELPTGREVEIQDKSPAYQAAYREAYTAAASSKFQRQVAGGSIVGILAGFVALAYAFAASMGT
jgi:hypothetical protein